jgi:hypothetical protein
MRYNIYENKALALCVWYLGIWHANCYIEMQASDMVGFLRHPWRRRCLPNLWDSLWKRRNQNRALRRTEWISHSPLGGTLK